jgi:hypothetical protein
MLIILWDAGWRGMANVRQLEAKIQGKVPPLRFAPVGITERGAAQEKRLDASPAFL